MTRRQSLNRIAHNLCLTDMFYASQFLHEHAMSFVKSKADKRWFFFCCHILVSIRYIAYSVTAPARTFGRRSPSAASLGCCSLLFLAAIPVQSTTLSDGEGESVKLVKVVFYLSFVSSDHNARYS